MKKIIIGLVLSTAALSANAGWFKSLIREITHPFSGSFAERVIVNPAAKLFGNEFAHTYIGGLNLAPGLNGDANLFNPWSPPVQISNLTVPTVPTSPVPEPHPYLMFTAGGLALALVYRRRVYPKEVTANT